jgi:hypothetical protein
MVDKTEETRLQTSDKQQCKIEQRHTHQSIVTIGSSLGITVANKQLCQMANLQVRINKRLKEM